MGGETQSDRTPLERRPAIFFVGSSNVGKRTLLSRLLSVGFDDDSDSELLVQGWTINTKYYTADVSVWMAHLNEQFSIGTLPMYNNLAALVMVFDMNDLSSLAALKDWVSHTDIQNFDILLCIGNKVDLVSGHPVHADYRRRLLKSDYDSADPYLEVADYGISETGAVLCWVMKNHHQRFEGHVWNGAVSITLNTLKLVLPILNLTNVCQLMVILKDLNDSMVLFLLICGLE